MPTRFSGASARRFPSLFDGGRESSRAATHVEFNDGVLSDAGSNPAASKLSRFARSFVGGVCRQVAPSFGLATVLESRRHQGVGGRWPPVDGVGVEPGAGVAEGPGDAEGAGVGVGVGAGDGAGGGADTGLSPIATSKLSKAKTS